MADSRTLSQIATDFETRAKLIRQKQAERKQLADQMAEETLMSLTRLISQSKELGTLEGDVIPEGVKQEMNKLAQNLESVQTTIQQIYSRRNQPQAAAPVDESQQQPH